MSVSNFAKNTLQSAIGSGATSIDIDTATSPYNNMPSSGRGFLKDSLDSPTKWEEITWTGRSAITGGYTLTGVTRNADSNTGAAQSFDAGHFITQDPSGTNKVVTDEAQTFSVLQTFSSGINLGDENLSNYDEGTFDLTPNDGSYTISQNNTYTRIGNILHAFIDFEVTATSSAGSGAVTLNGFPFSVTSVRSFGNFTLIDGVTHSAEFITPQPVSTSLQFRTHSLGGGSTGALQYSDLGATFRFRLGVTCEI